MRKRTTIITICLMLISPFGVHAEGLEPLFQSICQEAGIENELVKAIAKHESGMNPYAVNVAGRAHHPRSREEAERIIKEAHKAKKSFDVGLMQINSSWFSKWGVEPESMLDPETNIRAGVKILAGEIARHGPTWKAVGAYHTPCPERGRKYARCILNSVKGKIDIAGPTKEKHYADQKTGTQNILLYRRGNGDSVQRVQGRVIRF